MSINWLSHWTTCFILIILFPKNSGSNTLFNNVCRSYVDYLFLDTSDNCFHSPELFAQTTEIIERHIGFSETYNVTTEDGYILTLFRIPKLNPKGVIIMQHPVTTDSIVWVGQSNESFAFLLWNLGYDIWLPNQRGTYFSRKHANLTSDSDEYWNFSFHEIGLHDYKAIIDFVRNKTENNKIIFISHSMSTTASLIYASLRPEEAANSVAVFISMSPVCYLKHVKSPVKYLARFTPFLKMINQLLRITHLYEYDSDVVKSFRTFLLELPFKFLTSIMISALQGWNPEEFDPALINLSISQHPRSYPWKVFYHYVQQYQAGGRFQMYDYGYSLNKKLYKNQFPPEYPIEKIVTPVYLVYSEEDSISTPEDVELLYDNLNPTTKIYGKLKVSGINHVDFHYGKHRKEKVFDKIVELLNNIM